MKSSRIVLALALCFSASVYAAEQKSPEGETKIKLEKAKGTENKVDGDIDQEITNAKLRAESGSKSKYSLSFSGAYTGGAVTHAFGVDRPNLAGEPGNQENTSLDFGIDARYRVSKNNSFTLGTSFGLETPLQGRVSTDNQLDVYDPVVGFNNVGKLGSLQAVTGVSYGYGTSNASRSVDREHQLGASVTFMKGYQSGLSLGLSFSGGYNTFGSKPGEKKANLIEAHAYKPGYYGGDRRSEWSVGIYPVAEYAFNDTLSFRTVFGYFNWKHLYGDSNHYRLLQTYVYQSIGVGYAVTRDVYLYPNIQFVPDNIRSDFTNVALSATINVF